MSRIKTMSIVLAVLFLLSMTAAAVSAGCDGCCCKKCDCGKDDGWLGNWFPGKWFGDDAKKCGCDCCAWDPCKKCGSDDPKKIAVITAVRAVAAQGDKVFDHVEDW